MTGASIIIPVYNALEFARACIQSVYEARTSVPFEIIVVDNRSYPPLRSTELQGHDWHQRHGWY